MPHPPPGVYLGLDVAKATLAGHLAGQDFTLSNDPAGHRTLLARVASHGAQVQVICEATGGYERPVLQALRKGGVTLSVLQPARARQLAGGLGYLAKNDRLDAQLLARLGALLQPAPAPVPTPAQERLAALVQRRSQLSDLHTREKQHLETATDRELRRDLTQSLAQLEKRRTKFDALIQAHLQAHPALADKARRLQEAPGIGPVSAATLLAFLPELGTGRASTITSLAGLAPRDCQSGTFRGQRRVQGGRPKVRRILYLCALSAARHHPTLKLFYQHLRAAGKAPKSALIATARKLLCHLHSALKNPDFKFA